MRHMVCFPIRSPNSVPDCLHLHLLPSLLLCNKTLLQLL
jgi:hypothetical protein